MPSDPLPLSPEWQSLLDAVDTHVHGAILAHRPRIEQEARTLERAEVETVLRALFANGSADRLVVWERGRGYLTDDEAVERGLAALSRLGERE